MKLKVLDLFSGIGMLSYGLEKTGLYDTKLFCEADIKCKAVLKKHWPEVPLLGDVTYLDGYQLQGSIDVICGGFPCQDISLAGTGVGLEGSRSGLWSEFYRIIKEIKPRGVLIENVSQLRTRGLGRILQDLYEVGYDAEWHCITAKHFGACHERDRIFILAYNRSLGEQGFKPLQYLEKVGQGWESCKEDLLKVYSNPFGRSDSIPQPLLRRVDDASPGWMDRLKQLGNTVYWPIIKELGFHLHKNITH